MIDEPFVSFSLALCGFLKVVQFPTFYSQTNKAFYEMFCTT